MTGLDTILESIRRDGRENADSILKNAQDKASEILERGKAAAALRHDEIMRGVENEARDASGRVISAARRREREIILSARQEIISGIIKAAERSLYDLNDEDYFEVIVSLASKRAMPQRGELLLSRRDFERLPPDFEKKLGAALPKGAELTVSAAPDASFEGGFILVYGGIEENCTFKALFDDRREQLQDLANRLLFVD